MSRGTFELPFVEGPLRLYDNPDGRTTLMELMDNPGLMLRDQMPLPETREVRAERVSTLARAATYVEALRETGLKVPNILMVEGPGKSADPRLYIFVDKIVDSQRRVAPNLAEIVHLPRAAAEQIEQFIVGYLEMLAQAFQTGEAIFRDVKKENFAFGRRVQDSDDHLWLVDVDPRWVRKFDDTTDALVQIGCIEDVMYCCERLLGRKLPEARSKIPEVRDIVRESWYV